MRGTRNTNYPEAPMKRRTKPLKISSEAQVEAIASPMRLEVLHGVMACGSCTMKELAEHVGRLPESLYYHVNKLLQVGLIKEVDKRPTRRRPEAVYRAIAPALQVDPDERNPGFLKALAKLGAGILRRAERLNGAALERADTRRAGARRNQLLAQRSTRLSPQALARINARLDELIEEFDTAGDDGQDGEFFILTLGLAPASGSRP